MFMYQVEVLIENSRLTKTFSYQSNEELKPFVRVKVLFNHRILIALVVKCDKDVTSEYQLTDILEVLDEQPIVNDEQIELSKWMADYYLTSYITVLKTILPSAYRPSSSTKKPRLIAYVVFLEEKELKGEKQQAASSWLKANSPVLRQEFNSLYPNVLKSLESKGVLKVEFKEEKITNETISSSEDLILSPSQKEIYEAFIKQNKHQVSLLFGITGSGKSEIYLRLSRYWNSLNKQVLILVPEIGLTPQMIRLFKSRLGDNISIYHSHLSDQERYLQFQAVKNNEVNIVVGTRSAIFLPFTNLAGIIIDEEHDDSYKQEKMPKYHTRDIAIWRGKYHNCPVILASATPSLESYARALKKVYNLYTLPKRISGELPEVRLIDMNKELRKNRHQVISNSLKEEIEKTLALNQQVIILLNRRGYTPIVKCQSCQNTIQCQNCDIAMVYHKDGKQLRCHTCGASRPFPKNCEKCGSTDFLSIGYGTEKLEEELDYLFPKAKVLRMDKDTTTSRDGSSLILKQFQNHQADILVGTQMIAKGLDFPSVTLVGIINGDALLNRLDYRAQETTFALLMQAAGRAGRQLKKSKVLIQAYQIEHYALTKVRKNDYHGFFVQEMLYRKLANYPPYRYLVLITIQGLNVEKLQNTLLEIKTLLEKSDLLVLGPGLLLRKNNMEALRLTIKGKDLGLIQKTIKDILPLYQKEMLVIDVNPTHTEI